MSVSVTKPYYINIHTPWNPTTESHAGNPPMIGFRPPEPVSKTDAVVSAGYGNVKRDPLNNKTVYKTAKPEEYRRLGTLKVYELEPSMSDYREKPIYGPFIQPPPSSGFRTSTAEFGRAFGFY